ncbi:MAG: hypothetical protein COB76_06175 [Alphaproteobacteria bacterium]|nr:MAG: hypothetical protein COB76_06175 [Alphaproteobacteria bacterium]
MKAYVFDPLWPSLITDKHKEKLSSAGLIINLTTEMAPLTQNKELFLDTEDKILGINPDYVEWSLPSEKFNKINGLKAILTQSTSYGWIDTQCATDNGTAVVNTRNFSTDAVADWAILMMLNVARKVPLLIKNKFPLNYGSDFETYQGMNLKGKKAGIIGLGNIGNAIAEQCAGLGMEVSYWNRSEKNAPFNKVADLDKLIKESDVIFPTLADTEDTKNIITDEHLKSMQERSMLISIVHKSYNHELALQLASSNKIWGYGFEDEPQSFDTHEGNVWAAPAYGWCTDGSLRQSMDQFVDLLCSAAQGEYKNKVN